MSAAAAPGPAGLWRDGSGRACGGSRGRSEARREVCVPAARMDAALKRSLSEEPAELLPSARDLEEEEEEEGMEQELEEEEEVDPRIQVGRAGGAPAPGSSRAGAEVGMYTDTRLAAPVLAVCGQEERVRILGFTRFLGRLRCPCGCGLTRLRGCPPQTPGRTLGSPQRVQWMCNKGKKGAGAPCGYGGTPAKLPAPRALHGLLARGEGVGSRVGVVRPAAWPGTGALASQFSPGAGARPEPSSSFDSLLPN